ncbi:hypothetical protein [Sinosporangium siamense]|uniref:Uncharacterized protein n=1 Tax=Sinosporangium siamense TaxID=1367973 RepID=A0A919RHH7_9ACTN|nr:hypothetical protein [Sinosporangium siamense]GII93432.1 hypothetical protein Ssi02_36630 [Sinosporangium siamense]
MAISYYLWLPMFRVIWLFNWLVIGVLWIWAVLWTFTAVISYLSLKLHGRAWCTLVAAVVIGATVWTTDWETVYIDSQISWHRDELAALVAAHKRGETLTAPWWMDYLSIDGEIRRQGAILYLPVYEDWRAEIGLGIAHLPMRPNSKTTVQTASGDLGQPVRHIGDGWWWVE